MWLFTEGFTLASKTSLHIKTLGVTLDIDLNLKRQIGTVIKSSLRQLRLLAKVKPYLSFDDLERVIHAFIFILYTLVLISAPSVACRLQNFSAEASNWHEEAGPHHSCSGLLALASRPF